MEGLVYRYHLALKAAPKGLIGGVVVMLVVMVVLVMVGSKFQNMLLISIPHTSYDCIVGKMD